MSLHLCMFDGDHHPFRLMIPRKQLIEISGQYGPFRKCHKGKQLKAPGNFAFWYCVEELLENFYVMESLIHAFDERLSKSKARRYGTWRFSISFSRPIGWARHAKFSEFEHVPLIRLGLGKISRHTPVVYITDERIRAPKTNQITFVCTCEPNDNGRYDYDVIIIEDILPGGDIGWLGSSTKLRPIKKDEYVFFKPNHPVEPLSSFYNERYSCAPKEWINKPTDVWKLIPEPDEADQEKPTATAPVA